ncbi:hypothetical protein [Zavarzinella formosa]|uniref:hypothetical protein n=1 Tax=Zavarzinella formosa TaxID=360055 RepID=UPI0002D766C6|nr:hypothetical protein [Zavarzinella formosa]
MIADEFVKALKAAANAHTFTEPDNSFLMQREVAFRAWSKIKRRRRKKQDDPVLDLISRYDLTGVVIHQFSFVTEVHAHGTEQMVAQQPTYEYFVENGIILVMYYKESYPGPTGVTSALFLELLALRARMLAEYPADSSEERLDSITADYAGKALAITPLAPRFNFFGEDAAKFEAGKKLQATHLTK